MFINFAEDFQLTPVIDGWDNSYEISLRWLSLDHSGDRSPLAWVMT